MHRPDGPIDGKTARMLRKLGTEAEGSPFWVYAIRDPLTGDRRDWTTGDPFYVGQTNNPVRRAKRHMAAAGGTEGEPVQEHRARVQAILHQGRAPVFELLEAAPTRVAALAAEARWVRRLRAEGFAIGTSWAEHQRDETKRPSATPASPSAAFGASRSPRRGRTASASRSPAAPAGWRSRCRSTA
jgi:hypothetical protein